ncbi:MAG: DUF4124 domain-containing protein [Burkholderiales bacterium]|nr:DUF4124 domain-containing protein [Burkholderiales bacterium]
MKTKHLVLMVLVAVAGPAVAVNKCEGSDGRTVFQDAPCAGRGETVQVRPAAGAAPSASVPSQSEAQRLEAIVESSQRDRRKQDLGERLVPQARTAISRHRAQCDADIRRLEQEKGRYVQNLYGKTHAAQMASEIATLTSRCDTRERELKEAHEQLVKECATLSCTPL